MFSKIPVPQAEWTEENMKYMFCFFPFIGTVIGAVFIGVDYLGEWLSCPRGCTRRFLLWFRC